MRAWPKSGECQSSRAHYNRGRLAETTTVPPGPRSADIPAAAGAVRYTTRVGFLCAGCTVTPARAIGVPKLFPEDSLQPIPWSQLAVWRNATFAAEFHHSLPTSQPAGRGFC